MKNIDKYYISARQDAKRRKSRWNLIILPLSVIGIGISSFLIAKSLLSIQSSLFPAKTILASYRKVSGILMFVPIIFPSIGIGMIFANLCAWLIPSARKVFEQEAKEYRNASFKNSIKSLTIYTLFAFIICIPLSLVGMLNYFYVTEKGIYYNPLYSFSEKHYQWHNIQEIHTKCSADRKDLHLNYILIMFDGRKIDLMNEARLKFVQVYPEIKLFLEKQHGIQYKSYITNLGVKTLYKRYNTADAKRILNILQGNI